MKKNNVNMLSGSITKGLLSLSIPIMIMGVVQSLFNIIDMTALRFFCDDKAVGAVGACATLIALCTSLLIGIAAGANVVIAKRIGVGDKKGTDANVVITTTVNSFGADATTGIAIANQFDGILYQICYAPSLATIPYIAQNIGAKNIKRVKQTVVRAALITIAFGATFGMCSAVFSGQLSSIMSSSAEVIRFSQQKMVIISSTYFICGINEVMGGVLKGMGKPILPTIATFVFMCLFRFVWVYKIFPYCPNLTFLYLVWPIGWILSIITLFIAYRVAMSKLQMKSANFAC